MRSVSKVRVPGVCVVVATYNSPPELDDLVASLRAQTWDTARWEVRFVDDGSSDGTHARLLGIADESPNFHVDRIPSSGWPGRPRNVAVAQTDAEFVFFADHDDYFFPDALRRMYEFAVAHDVDVVHPKEVVHGWNSPGWRSWQSHGLVDHLDQDVLQCITPHKLYRRAFLEQHGITFPEGRVRLEDFSYNGDVWSRTDRIGIMADHPCYRWMIYDDNSHKAGFDFDVYWRSFESSVRPVAAMADSDKKDQLLVRWYRSRILERLGGGFHQGDEEYRARLVARVTELLAFFPARIDRHLRHVDRIRSFLLRAGDVDGLLRLSRHDDGIRMRTDSVTAVWEPAGLDLSLTATLVDGQDAPVRLHRDADGTVRRTLPDDVQAAVGDAAVVDVAEASGELVVRGRDSSVDWVLASDAEVRLVDAEQGGLTLRLDVHAVFDPATAAWGRPVETEIHDLFFRLLGPGLSGTHRVPALDVQAASALLDGVPAVLYSTRNKYLAVDLGSRVRTVVGTAQPRPDEVSWRRLRGTRVDLPGVVVRGGSTTDIEIEIDGELFPARLRAHKGSAWIETRGRWSDEQEVRAVVDGRRSAVLFR